jgi:hypothetical protein
MLGMDRDIPAAADFLEAAAEQFAFVPITASSGRGSAAFHP